MGDLIEDLDFFFFNTKLNFICEITENSCGTGNGGLFCALVSKLQRGHTSQHLLHTQRKNNPCNTETPHLRHCEKSLSLNPALFFIAGFRKCASTPPDRCLNSELEWVGRIKKKW